MPKVIDTTLMAGTAWIFPKKNKKKNKKKL